MKKTISMAVFILASTCVQAFAGSLTVALFDLSGSVLKDSSGQEGKDSPFSRNISELNKEIRRLGKGDTFICLGFGRKSEVTLLKVTMPKQSGPRNGNLIATREAAVRKLQENIRAKSGTVDQSRTDVIGGIYRASRLFGESAGASSKRLIIYSDMLDNETVGLGINRLKTLGSHKAFLKKLGGKNIGAADLKGIEVDLYSVFTDIKDVNTVETEIAVKELKGFWSEYFRKSGGIVKSFKTSY